MFYECQYEAARAYWLDNKFDEADFVLLLPQENTCLNNLFRSVFETKLKERNGIVIEGKQASALLNLYCIYAFTDRLIIGSFDLPYGRKLYNLIESGIATKEQVVNDVIFEVM